MKRVAVFVDVSNLYYCINKAFGSSKLDYRKYMEYCQEFGELYQCNAYGNQTKDEAIGFVHCLQQIGFNTKFFEPQEKKPWKRANWNCGIAVDVVNLIDRVDTIILGSADGDLEPIVDWARSKGASVLIIAAGISHRLKKNCTKYIEIPKDMLES